MTSTGKSWAQLSFWGKWYVINAWFCAAYLLPSAIARAVGLQHADVGAAPVMLIGTNAALLYVFSRIEVGNFSALQPALRRAVTWPLYACLGAAGIIGLSALRSLL